MTNGIYDFICFNRESLTINVSRIKNCIPFFDLTPFCDLCCLFNERIQERKFWKTGPDKTMVPYNSFWYQSYIADFGFGCRRANIYWGKQSQNSKGL